MGQSRLPETKYPKSWVDQAALTRPFLAKSLDQRFGELRGGAGNTHIPPIILYNSIRSVGVKNDSTDKNTVVFDR